MRIILMNVCQLNSDWQDFIVLNRKISADTVNDLIKSFTAEVQRTVIKNKMKITCTQKKFQSAVNHYVTALVKEKQLSEADATEQHMSTLTMIKKDRSDHLICMTQ